MLNLKWGSFVNPVLSLSGFDHTISFPPGKNAISTMTLLGFFPHLFSSLASLPALLCWTRPESDILKSINLFQIQLCFLSFPPSFYLFIFFALLHPSSILSLHVSQFVLHLYLMLCSDLALPIARMFLRTYYGKLWTLFLRAVCWRSNGQGGVLVPSFNKI